MSTQHASIRKRRSEHVLMWPCPATPSAANLGHMQYPSIQAAPNTLSMFSSSTITNHDTGSCFQSSVPFPPDTLSMFFWRISVRSGILTSTMRAG